MDTTVILTTIGTGIAVITFIGWFFRNLRSDLKEDVRDFKKDILFLIQRNESEMQRNNAEMQRNSAALREMNSQIFQLSMGKTLEEAIIQANKKG